MGPSATEQQSAPPSTGSSSGGHLFPAALLLVLTAAASLWWSHFQLLWFDEILVQWTDSVATARQVAEIQMHTPISLDPIEFHEIEHATLKVFGSGAFALRLPALIGFLLMQICLFVFARRIGGRIAGTIALAFPVCTGIFYYASNARPYGLILGFSALAMVSWQAAVTPGRRRTRPLIVLALALIAVINIHYYGFLIMVALFAAEMTRTIINRRIDIGVWGTFGIGACGILSVFPTLGAAREFLPHLWDREGATLGHIWRTYFMSMPHFAVDHESPRWMMAAFLLCFVILFLLCILQIRFWLRREMLPVTAMVGTLMGFPILGFFSALATHALEPRYLITTILGVSCFVAISMARWIPEEGYEALTLALAIAVALSGLAHGRRDRRHQDEVMASFAVSPEVKSALMASPTKRLYTANAFLFSQMTEYEPDEDVRSRLALVYSEAEEVRYGHMDTFTLTALHMSHFTSFNTEAYESLASRPGEHFYLLRPIADPIAGSFGSDWITTAAELRGATLKPLGKLAGGEVVFLSIPAAK